MSAFDKHMDKSNLRYAFNLLAEKCSGFCGCFDGDDEKGYRYVLGGKNVDVVAAGKALNEALEAAAAVQRRCFRAVCRHQKFKLKNILQKFKKIYKNLRITIDFFKISL